MSRGVSRAENRRRWADKYDRRDGPPVAFSSAERDHTIDMALGSRALAKSILATGKSYSPLTGDQVQTLKENGLLR